MNNIENVDICCGLAWGDEAKGKLVSYLAGTKKYKYVCRWSGGNNAGHTVYVNGKKYKTHLIPSGVFHGITSVIGPACVINKEGFQTEIDYLKENGIDTSLIKISPKTHVVLEKHIMKDKKEYGHQGTTSKGIAPCYADKYARTGTRVENDDFFKDYLWDGQLSGNVLCEGAQGFWLDIDEGNYPYTTSSTTLPYGACSLGFPPQKIRNIYGASKIYDTRSGTDPIFPEDLLKNEDLYRLAIEGKEHGVTTGRMRKTNWLNMNKLIHAVNVSGTTHIVISKMDVIENLGIYKAIFDGNLMNFETITEMQTFVYEILHTKCEYLKNIVFSNDPENIDGI